MSAQPRVSGSRVSGLVVPIAASLLCLHCSSATGATGGSDGGNCSIDPAADAGDDGDDDGGDDDSGSPCAPPDTDGINGGCYVFDVTVNDTGFSPLILKAQNLGTVTLHLTNTGTKPHDFSLGCIGVSFPGCPTEACFPASTNIAALAPGASATSTFVTPNPEGIYDFRSDVAGDSTTDTDGGLSGLWGQFVVQ